MNLPAKNLPALQQLLTSIAREQHFSVHSSFADRHGFPEIQFMRRSDGVLKYVSVALDTRQSDLWLCAVRASASHPTSGDGIDANIDSKVIAEFSIIPTEPVAEMSEMFRYMFKRAVQSAHDSYEAVQSKIDVHVEPVKKISKRLSARPKLAAKQPVAV